jgi:hypothetical protein
VLLARSLGRAGHTAVLAGAYHQAEVLAMEDAFDLVLLDVMLPDDAAIVKPVTASALRSWPLQSAIDAATLRYVLLAGRAKRAYRAGTTSMLSTVEDSRPPRITTPMGA